jgi:hypothetical protein
MVLSLEQYAQITQALGFAGLTKEEVLTTECISNEEWQDLRAAWDQRIAQALESENESMITE